MLQLEVGMNLMMRFWLLQERMLRNEISIWVDRSAGAIFTMGLLLGVLVYFSPCAFPILPGYISYCIGLGQREDELIESGKLENGTCSLDIEPQH